MTTAVATMTTAVAATAIARATAVATTAAATAATVAAVTSQNLVVTAHQGDADDREENRDPENQCTIHPKNLQQTGTSDLDSNQLSCRRKHSCPPRDGGQGGASDFSNSPRDFHVPDAC
jgi:hypothetical protein